MSPREAAGRGLPAGAAQASTASAVRGGPSPNRPRRDQYVGDPAVSSSRYDHGRYEDLAASTARKSALGLRLAARGVGEGDPVQRAEVAKHVSRSGQSARGTLLIVIALDLRSLHEVHRMTPAMLTTYSEAAAVILERFHASTPRDATVTYRGEARPAWLTWHPASELARATYGSATDAKEVGAYAIAIATAHALEGWRARGRAHDGSGADFILGHPDLSPDEFMKMEVSGVAPGKGTEHELAEMKRRLVMKVNQAGRGDLDCPGFAVIVGFQTARVFVTRFER